MTPELNNLIEQWNKLSFVDRLYFYKLLQIQDGINIQLGVSTGTKIGTSATQKLGFFGATPVVQQTAIAQASGGATVDSQARAAINSLLTEIHNLGLIA